MLNTAGLERIIPENLEGHFLKQRRNEGRDWLGHRLGPMEAEENKVTYKDAGASTALLVRHASDSYRRRRLALI